jgi:hypothetical protein
VVDEGFLFWRHAGDTHRRSLQAEHTAKLYTNQLRLRIPPVQERGLGCSSNDHDKTRDEGQSARDGACPMKITPAAGFI